MSSNMFKINRKFICATCLSQNRMLFAVSDAPACAKFYSDLSLKWTDKLCWECHHMVRKLVVFKNKAQKAQAWLRNSTRSQQHEIPCLSTLSTSAGLSLNVTDPGLTNSTKQETVYVPIKEIDQHEESVETIVRVKEEQIEIEVEVEPKELDVEDMVEEHVITSRKRKLNSSPPIQNAPDLFREEKLTEDGLTKWWQRKRKMKYFTQSLPDERCDQCVQPFDSAQLAKIHAPKHTAIYGDIECNICKQRLVDETLLEFHKKLHYRLLKCNRCEFAWDDPNTVREHCSDVHGIEQTVWDCEPCKRQYTSYRPYANHIKSHRRTGCPDCGKVMNHGCLKLHMSIKHRGGLPPTTCGECGGSFRGREELRAHAESHKKEADPAAFCTECMTQFKNMTLFRTHIKQTQGHAAEKEFRYQCKHCRMKFIKREKLRKHRQLHNDIPCDQCEQIFISVKARDSHIKKIHEKLRDKLCDYCGRGFSDKAILVQHINTHTGARPFVCKLCGAAFGFKGALYLHGRYKHKIPKKKVDKKDKIEKKKDNTGKDSQQDDSAKGSEPEDESVNRQQNDNLANSQEKDNSSKDSE